MLCSSCGKTVPSRVVWRRTFPDVQLCQECLTRPEVQNKLLRDAIAHALHNLRLTNRNGAIQLMHELRGTGVPSNPKHDKTQKRNSNE